MITIKARRTRTKQTPEPEIESGPAEPPPETPSYPPLLAYMAKRPPSLIGIDACADAHLLASELRRLGHVVKIIYPQFFT